MEANDRVLKIPHLSQIVGDQLSHYPKLTLSQSEFADPESRPFVSSQITYSPLSPDRSPIEFMHGDHRDSVFLKLLMFLAHFPEGVGRKNAQESATSSEQTE